MATLADSACLSTAISVNNWCMPMDKTAAAAGGGGLAIPSGKLAAESPVAPGAAGVLYRAPSTASQAAPGTPEGNEEQQLLLRDLGRRTSCSSRASSQDPPSLTEEGSSRAASRAGRPPSPHKPFHRPPAPRPYTPQQQRGVGAVYQRQRQHPQQGDVSMHGQTWQQQELMQEELQGFPHSPSTYHQHHQHHLQQQQHQLQHARNAFEQQAWLPQGPQVQPVVTAPQPIPLLSAVYPEPPPQRYQAPVPPLVGQGGIVCLNQEQLWQLQQQQQQQQHQQQQQQQQMYLQQQQQHQQQQQQQQQQQMYLQQQLQAAGYIPVALAPQGGVVYGKAPLPPPTPLMGPLPGAAPPAPHMPTMGPCAPVPLPPPSPLLPPHLVAAGGGPGGANGLWLQQQQGLGYALPSPPYPGPGVAPSAVMPVTTPGATTAAAAAGWGGVATGTGMMGCGAPCAAWQPPPPSPPPTPPRAEAPAAAADLWQEGWEVVESLLPASDKVAQDTTTTTSSSSSSNGCFPLPCCVFTSWEALWVDSAQRFSQWTPSPDMPDFCIWPTAAAGGEMLVLPTAGQEPGSGLAAGRLSASLAAAGLVVGGEEPLLLEVQRAIAGGHVVCVGGAPW